MLALLTLMSLALGVSSFLAGILPLSFVFSKNHLDRLSSLGTGLLLGTALGVIIPEGLEAVISDSLETSSPDDPHKIPTTRIALSLLFGFTFMLVIEQLVSPHSHSYSPYPSAPSHNGDLQLNSVKSTPQPEEFDVEFDARLEDPEQGSYPEPSSSYAPEIVAPTSDRAFPLTLGLFIHGLADGLALGASALAPDDPNASSHLSLIVFIALIIHKAPTSLALTTSLLASSLPRSKCKKYLAIFSSSTPIGALVSYLVFSFFGQGDNGWTGTALLLSGASFLYVATVLQPISEHSGPSTTSSELRPVTRVLHVVAGMCIPYILSSFLGHGH